MTILAGMQNIKVKFEEIKPNFYSYITNQSIPLAERWAVFAIAPSDMKEHEHYGPSFDSLHSDFVMYEGPIHMERGQTMKTLSLIERIEENLQEINDDSYFGPAWHKPLLEKVDLDVLKEEIMAKNLGSFDYDW